MTKLRLYPKGSAFYTTLPSPDVDRPKTFAIQSAMDNFWDMCQASVNMSLTVSGTTIFQTLAGLRKDVSNVTILQADPLTLVDGVGLDYTSGDEFASPLKAPSLFVPGSTVIGSDLTWGDAALTLFGELYHSTTEAQPKIAFSTSVAADSTGWLYTWSIIEPGTANKTSGNFLKINGDFVPSWLSWSGAGVIAPDTGLVTITTTQSFIWP